jgi:L-threonylcarbamoyladenylate synthase
VVEVLSDAMDRSVAALARGGVVVYPTETLYGLGARADSAPALERLGTLKGADRGKPVSVLVASRSMLEPLVASIPEVAERLMEALWPGPLTIVFRARPGLAPSLAGGGTIGARLSSHPIARSLVERVGSPITATSANPGGSPPPADVTRARAYFGTAVDAYLDAGPTQGGVASSVIDCSQEDVRLVREGAVPVEQIEAIARMRVRRR